MYESQLRWPFSAVYQSCMFVSLSYFFDYKTVIFLFENNPTNLDKTDLEFRECFGKDATSCSRNTLD